MKPGTCRLLAGLLLAAWPGVAAAAELRIERFEFDPAGRPVITFRAEPSFYYVLREGLTPDRLDRALDLVQPAGDVGQLFGRPNLWEDGGRFYLIQAFPTHNPADLDGDLINDLVEIEHQPVLDPLNPNDAAWDSDGDGIINRDEILAGTDPGRDDRVRPATFSSSPAGGETGVAVTRETVLRFSRPLSVDTSLSSEAVYAIAAGRRLLSRIELSSDRRTATLFYLENLPGSARVQVHLLADAVWDDLGLAVDGDGDGQPGGEGLIAFETLSTTPLRGTTVCGRVFASELAAAAQGLTNSVNLPLSGVIVTADGLEETVRAMTDAQGNFCLTNAPPGSFFVHVDGRNVTNASGSIRYPDRAYYPFVGKRWASRIGGETNVGEIYLPLIAAGSLQPTSATRDTTIALPADVIAQHPALAGVSITVPANALFADDGTRGGRVGLAPVPADRLPGPLPEGLKFPLVITVQTDGPANFDRPVPACFPNLPDPTTGAVLPPGARTALWSFNHDTGEFEVVGPMVVSADGRLACTLPGVGILAPGWHGVNPGTPAGGGPPGIGDPSHPGLGCTVCYEPPAPEGLGLAGRSPAVDVNLASGEFFHSVVDLRVKGIGFDFEWRRTYRSLCGTNTAQGHHWDYAYNIAVAADGEGVQLANGTGRRDLYMPPDIGARDTNIWVFNGFFRELYEADDRLVQVHEDGVRWYFHPPDHAAAGKIERIEDRYGNDMHFQYDAEGRLVTILDTVNRAVRIGYHSDGYISSVRDFAGREVRYEYYDGTTTNGVAGDLKYVTRPRVVNTSTGNDFPLGKTTTYTYLTGPEGHPLAHKLTSIHDYRFEEKTGSVPGTDLPRPPYLINAYGPDGKIVRQILGGGSLTTSGGVDGQVTAQTNIIDITYRAVFPEDPTNPTNRMRFIATVNDRMGNVQEQTFDCAAQLRELREYTGRADPTRPTTDRENRPGPPLRPSDPRFFQTRLDYNDDFQPVQIIYPNTNVVGYYYEASRTVGVSQRLRGNVIKIVRRNAPFNALEPPPDGWQEIVEQFEYLPGYGNHGAFRRPRFVTRMTDGRGHVTENRYDSLGNLRRRLHPEPDVEEEFEYNGLGQRTAHVHPANAAGYRRRDTLRWDGPNLVEEIADADGLRLTNRMAYNEVGTLIRRTDPRGNDTQFEVNALDQVVLESAPLVSRNPAVRYTTATFYNRYNDVTNVVVQNFVGGDLVQTNPTLSTAYAYDLLHNLVRTEQQVAPGRTVITERVYDANRNLALVRHGEAVAGRQPKNEIESVYDERNLLFRQRRAPGHAAQSTVQFDYDGNRNRVRSLVGLETTPHVTAFVYDGFDRLVGETGPMGSVTLHRYDANGNATNTVVLGELWDLPGDAGNVRLSEVFQDFDALNRRTRTSTAHFTNGPPSGPVGDGFSVRETDYAPNSLIIRTRDDRENETRTTFDTADRVQSVTDAAGNETSYTYDANGNPVEVVTEERSDLGRPAERFRTRQEYDALDRLVRVEDSAGNITRTVYDSRNNPVAVTDGRGNTTISTYDGLNRLTETTRALTDSGTGTGAQSGTITTRQVWDDSSRLVALVDANGHTTAYEYDPLNRPTAVRYADQTVHRTQFDVFDNPIRTEDANGTVVSSVFDAVDRLTERTATPGTGVAADTSFELHAYDGLSRLVRVEDDAALIERTYDSLSHLIAETVSGLTRDPPGTAWVGRSVFDYDGAGNRLRATYPGGRELTYRYDSLNRLGQVLEQEAPLARYFYVGPGRIERRQYANQTRTDWVYDGVEGRPNPSGDAGVRRPVSMTHTYTNVVATGGTPMVVESVLEARTFTWDPAGNKTSRTAAAPLDASYHYRYDSADRLVRALRAPSGGPASTNDYVLDKLGNRSSTAQNGVAGFYVLSPDTPEPQDAQVNQYTATPFDVRTYDAVGNLSTRTNQQASGQLLSYDAFNRLVAFSHPASGLSVRYTYDALGRRIQKTVNGTTHRFFYAGFQTIEEQDGHGTTLATWVHGQGLDEILSVRRGTADYYHHTDDLQNLHALTDMAGQVVERYEYDDYGFPTFFTPDGRPREASQVSNPYLFQSHRYDPETGFYYCRYRYLDPQAGRFLQRDPSGYTDGPNLFTVLGNNPWSRIDPFGTDDDEPDPGAASSATQVASDEATQTLPAALPDPTTLPPPPGRSTEAEGSASPIESLDEIVRSALPPEYVERFRGLGSPRPDRLGQVAVEGTLMFFPYGRAAKLAPGLVGRALQRIASLRPASSERGAVSFAGWQGPLRKGVGSFGEVREHHIHAKIAFEGASGYSAREALSVSKDALKQYGVEHSKITGAQQRLFRELASSGAPNTLTHHSRIAYQAMTAAKMPPDVAKELVIQSQSQLIRQGIFEPVKIPWGK